MGLGAQVRITTDAGVQYNHATTSTGYACSSDPRVHFGLGPSKVVKEIDIVWPSRIHQTLHNVPADQILTITEKADGIVGQAGSPMSLSFPTSGNSAQIVGQARGLRRPPRPPLSPEGLDFRTKSGSRGPAQAEGLPHNLCRDRRSEQN